MKILKILLDESDISNIQILMDNIIFGVEKRAKLKKYHSMFQSFFHLHILKKNLNYTDMKL